jgi:hypothetical protein
MHAQEDTTVIEGIHRITKDIDMRNDLKPVVLENEMFMEESTDGGGVLTAWMHKRQVLKLVEWVGLSSCVNVTEYYFHDGQLVFVTVEGSEYAYVDSLGAFDRRVQRTTMEARFHYHAGEVVKQEVSGSTRCGGPPSTEWATLFQERSIRLSHLFER